MKEHKDMTKKIKDSVDCMKLKYVNCRVQQKDDVILVVMSTT